MGANNGRVDHGVFVVCIHGQMLEQFLPYALFGPAAEAGMHYAEVAEPLGQVTPWYPGAIAI